MEDGLGLTTITGLFSVITTLSLSRQRILALLILGHLVGAIEMKYAVKSIFSQQNYMIHVRVLLAGLTLAVYPQDHSQ